MLSLAALSTLSALRKIPCYSKLLLSRSFKEKAGKGVKPGSLVVLDGVPYKVSTIIQGKKGKGGIENNDFILDTAFVDGLTPPNGPISGGFVKAKLKNVLGGNLFEKTFLVDEIIELAEMEKETVQYSWEDTDELVFMDTKSFEEVRLLKNDVKEEAKYITEGLEVKLQKFQGRCIGIELPNLVAIKVVSIEDPRGGSCTALLSTGAKMSVPDFVIAGNTILVNTLDGNFSKRLS